MNLCGRIFAVDEFNLYDNTASVYNIVNMDEIQRSGFDLKLTINFYRNEFITQFIALNIVVLHRFVVGIGRTYSARVSRKYIYVHLISISFQTDGISNLM